MNKEEQKLSIVIAVLGATAVLVVRIAFDPVAVFDEVAVLLTSAYGVEFAKGVAVAVVAGWINGMLVLFGYIAYLLYCREKGEEKEEEVVEAPAVLQEPEERKKPAEKKPGEDTPPVFD